MATAVTVRDNNVPFRSDDRERFDLTNNIPDCPLIPSADELKQNLVEHTTKTSKVALPHYNREHQTNYELVEPVTCNGIMREGQLGYHCNFKASETSHDDSSAKLFFAELLIVGHDDSAESNAIYSVTVCCPLEDGESTPCCKFGCRVVLHPKNGC